MNYKTLLVAFFLSPLAVSATTGKTADSIKSMPPIDKSGYKKVAYLDLNKIAKFKKNPVVDLESSLEKWGDAPLGYDYKGKTSIYLIAPSFTEGDTTASTIEEKILESTREYYPEASRENSSIGYMDIEITGKDLEEINRSVGEYIKAIDAGLGKLFIDSLLHNNNAWSWSLRGDTNPYDDWEAIGLYGLFEKHAPKSGWKKDDVKYILKAFYVNLKDQ